MLAFLDKVNKVTEAAYHILIEGIVPSAMELLDKHALGVISDYLKIDFPKDSCLLLIEFDGTLAEIRRNLRKSKTICKNEGAIKIEIAEKEEDNERLWKARRNVSPALSSIKPNRIAEDVVLPMNQVSGFVKEVERIGKKYDLLIPIYGHIGDGNLHPSILFDERDPDETRKAELAAEELVKIALDLGGTLSGEHGIGLSKRRYFALEHHKAEIEIMKKIKKILDPQGILNPGKIFGEPS
jgi:glycolate oxidase